MQYIITVCVVVGGGVPVDETGIGWLRYLFLLNQWIPTKEKFWWNLGAVWTVSVFAFFYLLVPIYYRFVKNYRTSLVGIVLLFLMARLLRCYTDGLRPLQCLYEFAIGITVWLAVKEKKEWNFTILICLTLVMMWVMGSDSGVIPELLVAVFVMASSKVCLESRLSKAINTVSRSSYSIYLIHAGVLVVMDEYRPKSDMAYLLIFTVTVTIASWMAHQLVEKRLGNLLLQSGKM